MRRTKRFGSSASFVECVEAFVAGVLLVVLLIVVGKYFSNNVDMATRIGPYKLIFGALFIGITAGYNLGLSAQEGVADQAVALTLGILLTFAAITLYLFKVSLVSGTMVISATVTFLVFDSRLASRDRPIRVLLDEMQAYLWAALLLIGFLQYGVPILVDLVTGFLDWFSSWMLAFSSWATTGGLGLALGVLLEVIGGIVVLVGIYFTVRKVRRVLHLYL